MKISMKLVYQYLTIFFNFQIRSSHLHPLQVENCDSDSQLVVDEDENGKLRPERVKHQNSQMFDHKFNFEQIKHVCENFNSIT